MDQFKSTACDKVNSGAVKITRKLPALNIKNVHWLDSSTGNVCLHAVSIGN